MTGTHESDGSKNVYDFRSLSEVIAEMRTLADRADINATILSPVDLSSLETPRGLRLARKRVESGADGLLASAAHGRVLAHARGPPEGA